MASDVAERPAVGERSPKTVYEDDVVRISGSPGGREALVIAFTGIGHRMGAMQREEFVNTSRGGGRNSVLFVQDKTRSWYNEPTFLEKLAPVVAEWAKPCARTVTIGNSMGGFGAVLFAGALQADTAIAFSPQYSVSPNVVPHETRWREFREKIAEFRYESAGPYIVDGCRYFIFQGDATRDWYQVGGFPIRPNVKQFVVRGGSHNLAAELRARRLLTPLVDACVAGDLEAVEAIAVGRVGAVLRSSADDPYTAAVRPRPDRRDDVEEADAEEALPPPENDEKLRKFQARRQRRTAGRIEVMAAAREANREGQQTERERLAAERVARKDSARAARAAERRAAAIARGAELAAERKAARPKRGFFAKARRKLAGVLRSIGGAVGLGKRPNA